jgi:gluconate 2-dehydrogenase subunit 3-like protein
VPTGLPQAGKKAKALSALQESAPDSPPGSGVTQGGREVAWHSRCVMHSTVSFELRRREFLHLLAVGAGATLLPLHSARLVATRVGAASTQGPFLTSDELAILDAATAYLIPTDSEPGARECGVVDYIQSMLSFMPGSDANCDRGVNAADVTATVMQLNGHRPGCPAGGDVNGDGVVDAADVLPAESAVFGAHPVVGGGPFSGRQPQPHFPTGATPCHVCHAPPMPLGSAAMAVAAAAPVDNYPPDSFKQSLPLPRLQALSWTIRILGAAAVPEVAKNPLATTSLEVDLRRKYRAGLAALEAISQQQFSRPFVQLPPDDQTTVFIKADQSFVTLLTYHTIEGMFCAPEYGGNRGGLGWKLIGFGGDSQPLGYEIYDPTVPGHYRERPDKPNSGPNPDEDCSGFSRALNGFLTLISTADPVQPGAHFRNPYCLDVPK